ASAGFFHPRVAAKMIEARGAVPDVLDAGATHIGKFETGQHARSMTGKRGPVRRNGEKDRAHAVHAGLGAALEIIGYHEINLHLTGDAFAEAPQRLLRSLHL